MSPVAWSLGLELTFYLLVPYLMPRPRLMLGIFIVSLVTRYVAFHQFSWQGSPDYALIWSYRFFPFEIALFLAGAFAHGMLTKISDRVLVTITSLRFMMLTVSLLIVAFGIHMLAHVNFHKLIARLNIQVNDFQFAQIGDIQYFWSEASYWCFYVTVFFGMVVLFQNTKSSKLDSKIGELSYPIYILHLPVIWFLLDVIAVSNPENVIYLAVPGTILLALVFCKIQKSIDDYRHMLVKESASLST